MVMPLVSHSLQSDPTEARPIADSKSIEICKLPDDWKIFPLGDLVQFLDGQRRPVKELDRAKMRGDIPYYGASGVVDYVDKYLFDEELILLGEDGENILSRNLPLAFRVSGKSWVNNHAHVLRPNAGLNIDFIAVYLESLDYDKFNSGTAQPKLNKQTCLNIPVALPPTKDEQDAIAEVLRDWDAFIEGLDRLIAKKRQIKQGAMQELLSGQRRLPGFGGEWGSHTFSEIFDFQPTATNSRADLGDAGDTYYIHYGDIHTQFHSHLNFRDKQPPKIARHKCRNAAHVRNGDWIMADASEDFDGVCKSIEVLGLSESDKVVSGLHTFLLREKTPTFAPGFKGHLGNLKSLRDQYLRVMTGMKVFGVSKAALRDLALPIPKLKEQEAIVQVLSDMDADIAALEEKLAKSRRIKQGMMQELLTGRVRLK